MNSVNRALVDELDRHLALVEERNDIRVLILTGGTAFCAGADLKEVLALLPPAGERHGRGHSAVNRPACGSLPKPVIASLERNYACGGLELAMCAGRHRRRRECTDWRRARKFRRLSRCRWRCGTAPAVAAQPGDVPAVDRQDTRAPAEMKSRHGLVCEVHPDAQLADATLALANLMACSSPLALARMKAVARTTADKARDDALAQEQVLFRQHMRSCDMEGKESRPLSCESDEICRALSHRSFFPRMKNQSRDPIQESSMIPTDPCPVGADRTSTKWSGSETDAPGRRPLRQTA